MATVSIPATATVGDVLTPTIDPANLNVTAYQWKIGADTIAVTPTFTARKIDNGKSVTLTITYNDGSEHTISSSACAIAALPVVDTSILRSSAHLRGGDGITIIPDGACEHGAENEQVAKVNWDGMYTYDSGGGTPYRPAGAHWYREISFGEGITPKFDDDKVTITASGGSSGGESVSVVRSLTVSVEETVGGSGLDYVKSIVVNNGVLVVTTAKMAALATPVMVSVVKASS